jgi:Rho-binding antiterminator
MSTTSTYQPINCEFHDVLETVAVRRTPVGIDYLDDDGVPSRIHSSIVDVYASGGSEYLQLASGAILRLDQLVEVDGVALSAFDADVGTSITAPEAVPSAL